MRELDYGVGVILKLLTQLGVASDTLVIFSSDNGGATYAKEMGIIIMLHSVHKWCSCQCGYSFLI